MSKKNSKTSNPLIRPVKVDGIPLAEHEAVWQYLIDHAMWTPYGWKVVFWIRNKAEWDWKVKSRMDGVLRMEKADELKLEKEALEYFISRKMNDKMGRFISKVDTHGNFYDKFMLWLYRKGRDYVKCRAKTLPDSEKSKS